jgi:phospholipid/cholesterol/gamma-HCH transport system substrate-binding protein
MGSQRTVAVYVGIFVITGLIILMWFSLELEGVPIGDGRIALTAEFDEVVGLSAGNPVTLRGVDIGRVSDMGINPETGKPQVTLTITNRWELRENAVARLVQPDLLGQRTIDITYPEEGPQGAALANGDQLVTERAFDIAQALGDLGEFAGDIRALIQHIDENQERAFNAFTSMIEDNRPRIDSILEQMEETIPRMESTAERIGSAAESIDEVAQLIREGEGLAARLVNDPTLADDVSAAVASLRDISERLQASDGTLWRLVEDDELYTQLQQIAEDLSASAEGIRQTFGAEDGVFAELGAFAGDLREIMPQTREMIENMSEVSAKINDGEGTIGLLVNDPSLYNDLRAALQRIGETFEEAEETGVIRTFLGVFFGAFM